MAVRNFYVSADITGRQTLLEGGPRNKDGNMIVRIHQRNCGEADCDVVKIVCREIKGSLFTQVYDRTGNLIFEYETKR